MFVTLYNQRKANKKNPGELEGLVRAVTLFVIDLLGGFRKLKHTAKHVSRGEGDCLARFMDRLKEDVNMYGEDFESIVKDIEHGKSLRNIRNNLKARWRAQSFEEFLRETAGKLDSKGGDVRHEIMKSGKVKSDQTPSNVFGSHFDDPNTSERF